MECDIFSRDYTLPSGATCLSKHDLIVGGECRPRRGGEMLLALAVGRQASALRGEEAGRIEEASG